MPIRGWESLSHCYPTARGRVIRGGEENIVPFFVLLDEKAN